MMLVALAFTAVFILSPAPAALSGGTLCITDEPGQCVAADARWTAPPELVGRPFTWLSDDSTKIAIGVLGETHFPLDQQGAIGFRVLDAATNTPVDAAVTLSLKQSTLHSWSLRLTRQSVAAIREVHASPGTYLINADALGYTSTEQSLHVTAGGHLKTHTLLLRRLPRVVGRAILQPEGLPAVAASIRTGQDITLGQTSSDGAFEVILPSEADTVLIVDVFGRAPLFVPIRNPAGRVSVGTINIRSGARLLLEVDYEPDAPRPELLQILLRDGSETVASASARMANLPVSVDLGRFAPGNYQYVVAGNQPLQRLGSPVAVGESLEVRDLVNIRPKTLHVYTFLERATLPNAVVVFSPEKPRDGWQAEITTDADGYARNDLWQSGRYLVSVQSSDLGAPYTEIFEATDDDEQHLILMIPDKRISGRVTDASTGVGVSEARVGISAVEGDIRSTFFVFSDDHGDFLYRGARDGVYLVAPIAPGYLPAEPVRLAFVESDHVKNVAFALRKGMGLHLKIVDFMGASVPGARVCLIGTDERVVSQEVRAGNDGSAVLTVLTDQPTPLWIIGPRGGFTRAVVTPANSSEREPAVVVLPPSIAGLELVATLGDNSPAAGVYFRPRFNGTFIPIAVLDRLSNQAGNQWRTGQNGAMVLRGLPAGRYELWPYSLTGEALSIPRLSATLPAVIDTVLGTTELRRFDVRFTPKAHP